MEFELKKKKKKKLINRHRPVGRVMSLKVLDEHFVNAIGRRWIAAGVTHGASATV